MNASAPVQVTLAPLDFTAELQKAALDRRLTVDKEADLRVLILEAAGAIGIDGSGKEGLLGYLKFAASTYPKQYMALLSKVLPMEVNSRSTVNIIEHVNIVSVPPDRYMPPENFKGQMIDHSPPLAEMGISASDPSAVQTIEDVLKNPTPVDIS